MRLASSRDIRRRVMYAQLTYVRVVEFHHSTYIQLAGRHTGQGARLDEGVGGSGPFQHCPTSLPWCTLHPASVPQCIVHPACISQYAVCLTSIYTICTTSTPQCTTYALLYISTLHTPYQYTICPAFIPQCTICPPQFTI